MRYRGSMATARYRGPSEARVGRLIAPADIGEMSLAVDFVSLVSGRPVADSTEILIGRLVMEG